MANYRIMGTSTPYSGMTVEINNELYTTNSGTLQWDSQQLVAIGSISTESNTDNQQLLSTTPSQGMGTPNTGNNRNSDNQRARRSSGTRENVNNTNTMGGSSY